jgi:hypothetical protein
MDIIEVNEQLSKIISDCEVREKSNYSGEPYICGYDGSHDISIRITFGDSVLFEIEHLGHQRMRKSVKGASDSDFESYFFILSDLINYCDKFQEQLYSFPILSEQDRVRQVRNKRSEKLDQIFP